MTPEVSGILYCNCTYAQIIDPATKAAVLRQLLDSGQSFEAVADLCEMSSRKDPALIRLASRPGVKIAACYPRAVKWLFASAGAPLDATKTEVLNMREKSAAQIVERILVDGLEPNLPAGKFTASSAPSEESARSPAPTTAESTPSP